MTYRPSRRKLLRLVGIGATLGFNSTVSATSTGENENSESIYSAPHSFDSDINIQNFNQKSESVSISVSEKIENQTKANKVSTHEFHVGARNNPASQIKDRLDIPSGLHKLDVALGEETVDSTTLKVPSGGIPSWMRIAIYVNSNDAADVYIESI